MSAARGYTLRRTSVLAAAPEDVWARVGTVDGANLELALWLRMTAPRHVRRLEDLPTGVPAFRSWLLLGGFVPIDADELCLVRVDPLHGFLERSRLLSAGCWEHERTLERHPEGTRLTDRLDVVVRGGLPVRAHRAAVAAIFRHRHRRLQSAFGGRPG